MSDDLKHDAGADVATVASPTALSTTGLDTTQSNGPLLRRTPLSKDPFRESTLITNVDIIKCSDLLLDVAATTTISSLTDGTPVLQGSSAVSYICFLGLTWWIWASQVLYNVRYRQKDWLHHVFVILQLLTFCALAAFAGGFDISQGIIPDDDNALIDQFASSQQSFINGNLATENARSDFLSRVNSTGISIVLAFSRLVILVQYLRAWSCAGLANAKEFARAAKLHVVSLSISLQSYVIALVVVRTDDAGVTFDHSIAKVVLWVLPIFLEMFTHCYINWNLERPPASKQEDGLTTDDAKGASEKRTRWLLDEANSILTRADVVFIILLGTGLDRITTGFQRIAGNVVVGPKGAGLIISAGIIFVTQLTLNFNLHKRIKGRMRHKRVLLWFFVNFFYFAALILTLQGTAALLELGNLVNALDLPLTITYEIGDAVRLQPATVFDPNTEFQGLETPLTKLGMSLENTMSFINNGTLFFYGFPPYNNPSLDLLFDRTDPLGAMFGLVRMSSILCLQTILKNLDATPDPGSLLDLRINDFLQSQLTNATDLNTRASRENYANIIDGVRKLHAEPADWFFGVAGATFVMQFILWHVLHPDWYITKEDGKEKKGGTFEAWIQGLRLSFGAATILLLITAVSDNVPPIDLTVRIYVFNDTLIHRLAQRGWMLAIFAGIILLEQILEQAIEMHTGRNETGRTDPPPDRPSTSRISTNFEGRFFDIPTQPSAAGQLITQTG